MTGYEVNAAGNGVAKLWKNGNTENLSDGSNYERGHSVFVLGSDVYVAGYKCNPSWQTYAQLWVNGVQATITDGSRGDADARSVFVSDGVVYVAGDEYNNEEYSYVATLWVNGAPQALSDGIHSAQANFVFVK